MSRDQGALKTNPYFVGREDKRKDSKSMKEKIISSSRIARNKRVTDNHQKVRLPCTNF